jgi:hypothetical protein
MQTILREAPALPAASSTAVPVVGVVALVASPALLAVWYMGGFEIAEPSRLAVLAQLLFLVGWFCSIVGLIRLSAARAGRARYLLWVQLCGVAVAATQELQDIVLLGEARIGTLYIIADAAWPASVLFMMATGTVIVRGGVLRGWRRIPALACGFTLPIAVVASVILGRSALDATFVLWATGAWGLLAWSLVTAPRHEAT